MIDPNDLQDCREAIRHGSRSFHVASKVLPARVRDPAFALYAFCRLADDAVDLQQDKARAVLTLKDRLDKIYQGQPANGAADRAFASVVEDFGMPRELPDALLEGLAWDALEKRYQSYSDLVSYSARVASAVGVMMCVLMGVRDRNALARAADLGVAMQLTNIARDVGEDAYENRLYLPLDWFDEQGLDPEDFLKNPKASPEIKAMVKRLLKEAHKLYIRSEAGVSRLPLNCRPGILAARHVYAGIARDITKHGYQSVERRAHTSKTDKLRLMSKALLQSVTMSLMPQSATIHAPPLEEVAFLIEATSEAPKSQSVWGEGRSGAFVEALAQLERHERLRKGSFANETRPAI